MQKFIPDYYYQSISEIPISILKEKGISAVICDLDNTLDSHRTFTPSETALAFLTELKQQNFEVCIISNGKQPRVDRYLAKLSLPYIAEAGKPLKKSYRNALKILKRKPKDVAFIGDQIFTDVWGANRMGLTTILVEPIESIENAFFYFKRPLEKLIKKRINKER